MSVPLQKVARGFTLVELLVVIGIIGLLLALLLPTLAGARRAAQATRCAAQLREIYAGISLYAAQNRGFIHRAPNRDQWLATWTPPGETSALRLISPNDTNAYWGSAYLPYMVNRRITDSTGDATSQIVEAARRYYLCPAMKMSDPMWGRSQPDWPVSYGLNGSLALGKNSPTVVNGVLKVSTTWYKLQRFKVPSRVIVAHDSAETLIETKDFNTLSDYGSGTGNLKYWRPGPLAVLPGGAVGEFYRHNRRSNVLWVDGHVEPIFESMGADVPKEWYDGFQAK